MTLRHFTMCILLTLFLTHDGQAQIPGLRESHIEGNVPVKSDFHAYLVRDLTAYSEETFGKGIAVDYELLSDIPGQAGVGLPKFYLWVTVTKPDKTVVDGAGRATAIAKQEFRIDTFVKRADIVKSPESLTHFFPQVMIDKINTKISGKQ